MRKTLKEIAELLGTKVIGDPDVVITGIAGIKEAKQGDITFLSNPKYLHFAEETKASAVIVSPGVKKLSKPVITADNPSLAFTRVSTLFTPPRKIIDKGVHPSVILGKDVTLGSDVAIGPYVVI